MTYNTINYSLDQKLYNFTINKIDNQLIEILFDQDQDIPTKLKGDKFVVYSSTIQDPGNNRPQNERRIQLAPTIKKKLHSYLGEDYKIVLIGYDKLTNTFTCWKYGYVNIDINTTQSLHTNINTLKETSNNGFAAHFYKNKKKTNNFSFSINAFLFPLILENYNSIFKKSFLDDFEKKILNWNKSYRKDELILCLDLYFRKYPLPSKKAPEILEVSNYCKLRSDFMGFTPREKFYHLRTAKTFRNYNGIGSKIENIASIDPTKNYNRKGRLPDPHAEKILKNNYTLQSNKIDLTKLLNDAEIIKNKINSNNINIFIDNKITIEETRDDNIGYKLQNFDTTTQYTNRSFNSESYDDPKNAFYDLDKKTELHEIVIIKLGKICKKKKLPCSKSIHIDFYTEFENRGKLFEIKTITPDNFKKQMRLAIAQLNEYYYNYAKHQPIIKKQTDLFILLDKNPNNIIEEKTKGFVEDQNIILCWFENDTINTFSEQNSKIDWLF